MDKIHIYVVLGEATGYDDPNETGEELRNGCGTMYHKVFETKAEADAYIEGLEDMSGLEDYQQVDEEFYNTAKTIANRKQKY